MAHEQLAGHLPGDAEGRRDLTLLPDVQKTLPKDAVLVEFAVWRPMKPSLEATAATLAAPRYAAWVMTASGEPVSFAAS